MTASGLCAVQHLPRHALIVTDSGSEPLVVVRPTGESRELYDLRVDSSDHLFYLSGILSHNSTGIGVSALIELNALDAHRALYLAPLQDHIKTFGDKLRDMERGSLYTPRWAQSQGLRNNLFYKESATGGSLRLMHVLTDATKVRGQSVRKVYVDEAQDFDPEHMGEIKQVQKAFAETKSTVIAGTSKGLFSFLEMNFQGGSRGIWHIRGGRPGLWYSLNDPETIRKLMSVHGLRCPETGKLLNPKDGEFVHEDLRRLYAGYPSFHLPQLIVPEYASGRSFLQIWKDFKSYKWEQFLQEVMGIPIADGFTELTEADLKACCNPELTFGKIWAELASGKRRYRYIISGCDWGGSDYNAATKSKASYTVHTIYGIDADGKWHLLHAKRYSGQHYQDIAGQIVNDHLRYKAMAVGADNGAGAYYNAYLADSGRIPRSNLVVFQYTETKMFIDLIDKTIFNIYSLHRTDSISALIHDIKVGRFVFPRWDESKPFLDDCLNCRRNITEAPSGRGIMRYMKEGNKTDDFLQSTNFATTLGRILLQESIIPNRNAIDDIRNMIANGPAFGSGFGGLFGNSGPGVFAG